MKKINLSIVLISLFALVCSCSPRGESQDMYASASVSYEMSALEEISISDDLEISEEQNVQIDKKKIIKNGRLGIRVNELNETKLQVDALIAKYNGYYANENLINSDYESSFDLNIRIPASHFEKFISELETGKGEILYKSIAAQDVTAQYIDLETRLESKRSYLTRYKEILKQAKTIKDILEIEEMIRNLQEEIESTEGHLRYLSDQVSYSTLNLNLSKEVEFTYSPEKRTNFIVKLKQSLSNGWFGFVDFLLVLVHIWPLWILLAGVVVLFRRIRRKRRNRQDNLK